MIIESQPLLKRFFVIQSCIFSLLVQAVWRGHRIRRHIKDKKVDKVRKKVLAAARNVREENKLYYRTSLALDFLLNCRQLVHVLQVLIQLGVLQDRIVIQLSCFVGMFLSVALCGARDWQYMPSSFSDQVF